jgi:hypothetical protein
VDLRTERDAGRNMMKDMEKPSCALESVLRHGERNHSQRTIRIMGKEKRDA